MLARLGIVLWLVGTGFAILVGLLGLAHLFMPSGNGMLAGFFLLVALAAFGMGWAFRYIFAGK